MFVVLGNGRGGPYLKKLSMTTANRPLEMFTQYLDDAVKYDCVGDAVNFFRGFLHDWDYVLQSHLVTSFRPGGKFKTYDAFASTWWKVSEVFVPKAIVEACAHMSNPVYRTLPGYKFGVSTHPLSLQEKMIVWRMDKKSNEWKVVQNEL